MQPAAIERVNWIGSRGSQPPNIPSKVTTDDSTNTANVPRSDKQNNKLSNKLTTGDTDLALVVALPEAISSAIVAIVRASKDRERV